MKKLLTFLLVFTSLLASAQLRFQKRIGGFYSEYGYTVDQTSDGGFIISGTTFSFSTGESDIYLVKTDANGNFQWTRAFGGSDFDYGLCTKQTSDGGYIIAGYTESFGSVQNDLYLIKTTASGVISWSKKYGSPSYDGAGSIQQTTDGGYIVAGSTSLGGSNSKTLLIKTNASGDSLWTKTFYGSTGSEWANSVQQTTDGGYILGGVSSSFGAGGSDVHLIKTDSSGNLLWNKTYGGNNTEYGYLVQQTSDGGYIVAGSTLSFGAGNSEVYLVKTDVNGDTLWTKTYGGTNSEYCNSVRQTIDGGYIIGARSRSFGPGNEDIFLIKADPIGNLTWAKRIGSGNANDDCLFAVQTTDGGYAAVGTTDGFSASDPDIYFVKTDSLGESGCYQGNAAAIVTSPATQVFSPSTIVTGTAVFTVTAPATVSGSGGTVYSICTNVGIDEFTHDNALAITPNPSDGKFNVSLNTIINKGNVRIINLVGEIIFEREISNLLELSLNIENATEGLYFLNIFDGEKYLNKQIMIVKD